MLFKMLLWVLVIGVFSLMISKMVFSAKKLKKADGRKSKIKRMINIVSPPLALLVLVAFFSAISFVNVDRQSQENAVKNYEVVGENYVAHYKLLNGVDEKVDNVYWNNIPENLKNILQNDWVMIYDEEVPTSMRPSITLGANQYNKTGLVLTGLTYFQKRLLFVNSNLNYEAYQGSYIHEYGHAVSYEYGTLHGSPEWKYLYYKYKNDIPNGVEEYYISDSAEFFAWSYSTYFLQPEILESTMPEIYNYMDDLNHTEPHTGFVSKLATGMKGIVNTFIYHLI